MLNTVLVTGGASGLGAAVAQAVQEAGGKPHVFDLVPPPAGHPHTIVDLSDTAGTTRAVQEVAENDGLDAVVTCAGIDACGDLLDVSASAWERVIAVNLIGTATVARAAIPYLEQSRGTLVTVASTLGLRALPAATAYSASKFGVVGFTRALALEMKDRVRVTCFIPGGMRTPFFDGRDEQFKPAPDAHLMDPRDVAATILSCLTAPPSLVLRELVVTVPDEPSWP
jgi:NAD(P)-dependent dehydrogenase (short-subunit alcohol dehydrogenase family)